MDIHSAVKKIVIRTYYPDNPWQDSAVLEYSFDEMKDICSQEPKLLDNGQEGQGEAVAYKYPEGGIVHVSEGYSPKIFNLNCVN